MAPSSRETSRPSKSGPASSPLARKHASMLAFTVLPKRRGRVMQMYLPVVSMEGASADTSPVLSTKYGEPASSLNALLGFSLLRYSMCWSPFGYGARLR